MKGYTEVNYCVYIKDGEKYFKFTKESIINNSNVYEPTHEPIKTKFVYNTFFMLYPILKTIPKDKLIIQKSWESWHPLGLNQKIPTNKYNKEKDKYLTNYFKLKNIIMNDNEILNYVFNNQICSEIKITDNEIEFNVRNPEKSSYSEHNEQIPFQNLLTIYNDIKRDFNVSSGYNSLKIKLNRLDKS